MSDRFDYTLPTNAINQFPYQNPEDSNLLIANTREIYSFSNLPELVQTNSLFIPSGSINIWWLSLFLNLNSLSSIDGQYLGPIPTMFPEYIAER